MAKGRRQAVGTEVEQAPPPPRPVPPAAPGGIFKSAAIEVLRAERRLMTTGEITKVAMQRGLLKAQGKTPEATMASALYTDIKKKSSASAFTRPQEGLFGLREWIEEAFFPEGFWAGGGPKLELSDSGAGIAVSPANKRRGGAAQHRIMQRGPDGQLVAAAGGSAGAAAAPSDDDAAAAPAPAPAAGQKKDAGEAALGSGKGSRSAATRSRAAPRRRGSALALVAAAAARRGAAANSDEDGSDHYNGVAAEGSGDGAGAGAAAAGTGAAAGGCTGAENGQGVEAEAGVAGVAGGAVGSDRNVALLLLLGDAGLAGGAAGGPEQGEAPAKHQGGGEAALGAATTPAGGDGAPAGGADFAAGAAAPADAAGDDALERLLAAANLPEGPDTDELPSEAAAEAGPAAAPADTGPAAAAADSGDEEREAAALLGGMAGARSGNDYYGGRRASPDVRDGGDTRPAKRPANGHARRHAPVHHAQQPRHGAAAAAAHGRWWQQAAADWQMMAQMAQWQQHMGATWGASPYAGFGGWPSASGPGAAHATGWADPAAAAVPGGGPDLLHRMSVSLGLQPPAPLPPLARRGAKKRAHDHTAASGGSGGGGDGAAAAAGAAVVALLSPKTLSDVSRLDEWQATIESAEKALGRDHPAVGRAWLDLARALQATGLQGGRARVAVRRAFDVLLAAAKGGPAGDSFSYLLERLEGRKGAAATAPGGAGTAAEAAAAQPDGAAAPEQMAIDGEGAVAAAPPQQRQEQPQQQEGGMAPEPQLPRPVESATRGAAVLIGGSAPPAAAGPSLAPMVGA